MPIESIEAATSPATSIRRGFTGTMPAVIRMIGPVQVIIGWTSIGVSHDCAQCTSTP